jgi:hypothetical protein
VELQCGSPCGSGQSIRPWLCTVDGLVGTQDPWTTWLYMHVATSLLISPPPDPPSASVCSYSPSPCLTFVLILPDECTARLTQPEQCTLCVAHAAVRGKWQANALCRSVLNLPYSTFLVRSYIGSSARNRSLSWPDIHTYLYQPTYLYIRAVDVIWINVRTVWF